MTAALAAWGILGFLLALTAGPLRGGVVIAAALPWIVGLGALIAPPGRDAVARIRAGLGGATGTAAVGMLLPVGFAIHVAFGPFATLLLLTWAAAGLLLIAARSTDAKVRDILLGAGFAGLVTALIVVAFEAVLSRPALADRLGTPAARARWEAQYDSLWAHNVLGLRSHHERVARRPGVKRVAALGDSFTWGDKIADADSAWPHQLEIALNADAPSGWEVLNLGQRGWTSANEAEFMTRLGWQLDPDVLVWQFFVNDTYSSRTDFHREGERWRRLLPARFRNHAAGNSATLYLLERLANMGQSDLLATYQPLFEPQSPGWRQFESALRVVADSASRRGVPVVFVLWPALVPGTWTTENYPLRHLYGQASEAARRAGFHVLDLTPVIAEAGQDWRSWWALPWDSHPNASGHVLTAAAVRRFLADSLQFSAAPHVR